MEKQQEIGVLLKRIEQLERENALLRRDFSVVSEKMPTVSVPENVKPIFDAAQKIVGEYFKNLKMEPSKGTIEINEQRYVLVRASALSIDFLSTILQLYADRGKEEAMLIGKNFLFDIAHVIGMSDAKNFHSKMNLSNPIEKLSAGPVHFAYSGWAFVDILPESNPSPDENYYLIYNHPFSFEADSWLRSGKKSDVSVCVMNAGYSSGWCEESFGIPLTAVEVTCKAKGDEHCTFIMSPPNKIQEHIDNYSKQSGLKINKKNNYNIPTFFERKNVEEQMRSARKKAEESDKAKSEFLANMSHEIRTPMNAIIGYVDIMLQDEISDAHRSYLETLKDSGKLLLNLINDILDVSKIEAGQLLLDEQIVSLSDILNAAESTAKGLIAKANKNIQLVILNEFSPNSEIIVDSNRIKQILLNLLSNAVKFTESGKIEIGVKLKDEHSLLFFVNDTGIGIEAKKHSKIFEMFGQADASTTREYGGTGLGLTISKKIIELMGGEIGLYSEKGKGSSFYFTLPYKPASVFKGNNHELQSESTHTGSAILLVEDNLINQRLTKLILEKSGFKVITANNGQEAVDRYKMANTTMDLILMDIQMPVLDGLSAAQIIRYHEAENKMPRIPIIALTAHAMQGDKEKCLDAGCDNYLSKPIMMELLVKTIKTYVK
jgi:CheY-like chemotaxis protein/nitrogen-specific signal transduction histidine kinase/predicted hydrocarbon binding protein